MSSNSTYTSYSSSSYATSFSANGQQSASAYQQTSYSNPSGTSVTSRSQNLGMPAVEETRQFDSQGREVPVEGTAIEGGGSEGQQGRIEDVSEGYEKENEAEIDRKYREAMEDEYAKREGGA